MAISFVTTFVFFITKSPHFSLVKQWSYEIALLLLVYIFLANLLNFT